MIDNPFGVWPRTPRLTQDGRLWMEPVAYDDFVTPVTALKGGAAAPPAQDWQGGLYRLKFAVNDEVHGEIQMPHRWVPGTDICPHVHWALDNTAGALATDAVQWELLYTIAPQVAVPPLGGVISAPGAAIVKEVTVGLSVAYTSVYSDLPDISMAGQTESAIVIFRLKRIAVSGVGATEYGDSAVLLGFDIHHQINKLGTAQELPPFTP